MALNLYKIREDKGEAGELFRSVYRQKPQYQGLWIVSPEGKALSSHQGSGKPAEWTKKVLTDLQAGLDAFGPVQPRRAAVASAYQAALPYRGAGVQPDGKVTLAVYHKYVIVQDLERDPPDGALGEISFDSIPLSAVEWSALSPPNPRPGDTWRVPEAVARKFYPVLSVSSVLFRDPKEVTALRLSGKVQAVQNGIAALSYEGELAGTHHGTADEGKAGNKISSEAKVLGGVGRYDVKTRRLVSLTFVWDGRSRNWAPYDDPATRFGAVVEWSDRASQ